MPRKISGVAPVTSLKLDSPYSQQEEDALTELNHDPLRDPLLPPSRQRQPVEMEHRQLTDHIDHRNSHDSFGRMTAVVNPSLRSRLRHSRVLDRDAAFHQSRGRWRVLNLSREAARFRYEEATGRQRKLPFTKRIWDDWFYSLAYQRTVILMFILFLVYGAIVVVFGFVYLGVSILGEQEKVNPDGTISKLPFCDMDIHDHMEALYFSLSTMTTIGYGVSDYYFGGCWTPLLLVLAQVCCAITFDAVAIGLLFQRISRGHKRGKTIMFSDRAAVQRVRGRLYLMFRLGELRHHQLREATVKAYCVRHERIVTNADQMETTHYVTRPLPLLHERLAGNSSVLMSLPQVLVHCLDEKSPLIQPDRWYDADGLEHIKSSPVANTSGETDENPETLWALETAETSAFLRDRETEIIILVEGTDELTGASIQARMSYTAHDLAWNYAFAPCIFPYEEERFDGIRQRRLGILRPCRKRTPPTCIVDFNAFHDLLPVPENVEVSPYVFNV